MFFNVLFYLFSLVFFRACGVSAHFSPLSKMSEGSALEMFVVKGFDEQFFQRGPQCVDQDISEVKMKPAF